MKPIAVLLWSLVGMAATSSAVAWVTPSLPTSTAYAASTSSTKAERPVAPAVERSLAPQRASESTPPVAAPPPVPAHFVDDGVLRIEGRVGHASLPEGLAQDSFVLVSVDAPEDRLLEERLPIDASIVIDRSGSMKGARLRNATAAARGLIERLGPDDRVSLIAYHGKAELLLPSTRVRDLDRLGFERTLRSIRHGGNTCMSCGLQLAMAQLRARDGVGRVLLLSDGKANRGLTTPESLRTMGDMARREQVAIASIGVDVDYDERTMFALSEASNGRHYFVEDPLGLPAVFDQERRALVGTVADRVDVDVSLAEGIELIDVVDRPFQRTGDTVTVSLGSFTAGDTKTVLMRVRVRPEGAEGSQPVASVGLAYRDLGRGEIQHQRGELGLLRDKNQVASGDLDPTVEARLGRKDAFDALLTANEAFDRGDVKAAEETLAAARRSIQARRERFQDAPEPVTEVDEDFEEQLQALGSASANFQEASAGMGMSGGMAAPPTASAKPRPKSKRQRKAATKRNFASADPFSN